MHKALFVTLRRLVIPFVFLQSLCYYGNILIITNDGLSSLRVMKCETAILQIRSQGKRSAF